MFLGTSEANDLVVQLAPEVGGSPSQEKWTR